MQLVDSDLFLIIIITITKGSLSKNSQIPNQRQSETKVYDVRDKSKHVQKLSETNILEITVTLLIFNITVSNQSNVFTSVTNIGSLFLMFCFPTLSFHATLHSILVHNVW